MRIAYSVPSATRHRTALVSSAAVLGLVLTAPGVLAQCQTNQNCWPPPGVTCAYPGPGPVFYPTFVATGIRNVEMSEPSACAPYPSPGGIPIDSFFDIVVILEFTTDGGSTWTPAQVVAPCVVRIQPPVPAGPDQFFETEMLQLQLHGGNLPSGLQFRENPSRPSQGGTTKQDLGGGLYRIDSFFDVFTEISLDGGQNWAHTEQPLHVTTIDRAPTPTRASTWGSVKVLYR